MTNKRNKKFVRRSAILAFIMLILYGAAYASPKYKVLHNFTGGWDGIGPEGVILDSQGNVYAASLGGGSRNCGRAGCGLVFELMPQANGKWSETVLYDFQGGSDGTYPNSPLVLDSTGNVYGTTNYDGVHGSGTAFELSPGVSGWTETTLFSFCPKPNKSGCADGGGTGAGLVRDASGNLYGAKAGGGGYPGLVFELSPGSNGWSETVLHKFVRQGDGAGPYAGLILDNNSRLYGTTSYGGSGCGGEGCGTVYELTPESGGKWKETILHRFDNNGRDGITPGNGALFMDASGRLYGTTEVGGSVGDGSLFRLTKGSNGRWAETILYNFVTGPTGWFPDAGVVMDKAGNLFGITAAGGSQASCGVIYELSPAQKGKWKYKVLHTFGNGYDGCLPEGNLAIDGNGNVYGGTIGGGAHGWGTVFELTP